MIAKNGIDWDAMGFTVYGECPEYKGYINKIHSRDTKINISCEKSYRLWERVIQIDRGNECKNIGILCEQWKQYENFKKWYDENIYEIENEELEFSYEFWNVKNNIISPETSAFIPTEINKVVRNIIRSAETGLMLNISVQKNLYTIRMFGEGIASSNNKEEIYEIRRAIFKRQMIDFAEKYKGKVPDKIYARLLNFELKEGGQ